MEKIKLVFLAAGEYPDEKNLLTSQFIRYAEAVQKEISKFEIYVVIICPFLTYLKNIFKYKTIKQFIWIKKKNIKIDIFFSLIHLDFAILYKLKSKLIKLEIKNKNFRSIAQNKSLIILCRSYLATNYAIELKNKYNKNIKIIFDLRSIFSNEIPLNIKKAGVKLYGDSKKWENFLLNNSDLCLMTTNRGVEYLKLENPNANIKKINLAGFNLKSKEELNNLFEQRWENKYIAYVGNITRYNSKDYLELVFNKLLIICKNLKTNILSTNYSGKYNSIYCKYNEIENYYKYFLGLILPGMQIKDYFDSFQASVNLFSTKAAEALSCGVPLIVNKDLIELSQFVKDNKCGIIFSIVNDNVVFYNIDEKDINKKSFWYELHKNAIKVSSQFSFENILKTYISYINELL